jgi:hypothetical protein
MDNGIFKNWTTTPANMLLSTFRSSDIACLPHKDVSQWCLRRAKPSELKDIISCRSPYWWFLEIIMRSSLYGITEWRNILTVRRARLGLGIQYRWYVHLQALGNKIDGCMQSMERIQKDIQYVLFLQGQGLCALGICVREWRWFGPMFIGCWRRSGW